MKFQYAPGLPGYGTQGTDGSNGLLGMSLYFCDMDGDTQSSTINGKINNNEVLISGTDKIPGYPVRLYQIGDMFVDVNGKVFKITAISPSAAYQYTNSRLNTSTIFGETGDTDVTDPEYIRYSNGYVTDRFLIDSVFVSNTGAVGDYYASPVSGATGIYGIGAKDFAQIKYVDYDVDGYHPYLLFSNTNAPAEPERAIALVKENGKNHWRLGNLDGTGVIRDVSLSLDFADIILNGDVLANNIKSIGDVSINANLYTQTIVPRTNNTYNLGSTSYKFNNGYITTLNSTTVSSTTVNSQNVIFPTAITGKIYSEGTGGNIDVSSGKGSYSFDLPGGNGGNLNLYGGQGGDGGTVGNNDGGNGGNIILQAGSGGLKNGSGHNGSDGYVIINSDVSISGVLDISGEIKNTSSSHSGKVYIDDNLYVNGTISFLANSKIITIHPYAFNTTSGASNQNRCPLILPAYTVIDTIEAWGTGGSSVDLYYQQINGSYSPSAVINIPYNTGAVTVNHTIASYSNMAYYFELNGALQGIKIIYHETEI